MSADPPGDDPAPKRRRGRPRKDEVRIPARPAPTIDLSGPKYEFINVNDSDPMPDEGERKRIRKQAMLHHLRKKRQGPESSTAQTSREQSRTPEQPAGSAASEPPTISPFDSPWIFPQAEESFRNSLAFEELRAQMIDYFQYIQNWMEPEVLVSILTNPARVFHLSNGLDAMNDRDQSPLAITLKSQLIRHINGNLSDPVLALSVENLMAVYSIRIGTMVYDSGRGQEAEAHVKGLSKMLALSGGIDALSDSLPGRVLQKQLILSDCNIAATAVRQLSFPETSIITRLGESENRSGTPSSLVAECPFYCPPGEIPFAQTRQSPLCGPETLELLLALYNFISNAANPQLRDAHRTRMEHLVTASPPLENPTSVQSCLHRCIHLCTLVILHLSPKPGRSRTLSSSRSSVPPHYATQLKHTMKSSTLHPFWRPLALLYWWVHTIGDLASLGQEEYPFFQAATVQTSYHVMVDDGLFVGAYSGTERWVAAWRVWQEEEGGVIEEGTYVLSPSSSSSSPPHPLSSSNQ